MMNYVKSEIYRVSRSRAFYFFTAILAGLSIMLNGLLGWFGKTNGNFPYNTTAFSYSNLVANPMVFCVVGALIGMILYEGNRKNGNLKNTIAFGIPRIKILAGQCIVATAAAVISLAIILAFYIGSANLFLEHTGSVSLYDLLTEVPAVFLLAVASLISGIVCIEGFDKDSSVIIVWVVIWFIIPKAFFYLGLHIEGIYSIAMWMPENFFGTAGMVVNRSQCITAWATVDGMAKCVISGMIGIAVFSLWGIGLLRKKEL